MNEVQLSRAAERIAQATVAERRDVLEPALGSLVIGVGVLAALALVYLGVHGLRLWSTGVLDGPAVARERAFRRSLWGLIIAIVCFVAVADIAVLSLWALFGGDF